MSDELADLERHRVAHRLNGFPIYDDDELTGYVNEPAWDWDRLTQEQQAKIRQEAVRLQTRPSGWRSEGWDVAFPLMLGEYGIRCPHKWVNREPSFRECRWCYIAQPLPGRVVRVGDRTMRVPNPPPLRLKVPVASTPSLIDDRGLQIDEYEWTGSRYVPAASHSESTQPQ